MTQALRRRDRDPSGRLFPVRARMAGLEAFSVAVMAWLYAAFVYRLWDASLRVPLYQDHSDARLIANLVKNTIDHGWYQTNPHLGAPFGQEFYDFPHGGETWQLTAIKGLSLFIKDYGLLMNTYFLVGFGLTAASAYLVLRHLRFGYLPAAVMSLIYSFLPFHFAHAESHLFRSSYWYAPLACLILLWSLQWRERLLIDPDPPPAANRRATLVWNLRHNLRRRRVVAMVLMLLLLAGTETMTTSFTMALLALTGLIAAIRNREPAQLLVSGTLIGIIAVTFVVLMYPTLNYVRTYGTNELAGRRQVTEQERYGLKISRMVLPDPAHRNGPMRRLGFRAQEGSPIISEAGQTLTTIGTFGLIAGLYWILTRGWGRRLRGARHEIRPPHERRRLLDNGALVIILSILVGTVAGFAVLLSVAGFSQVRVWNRIVLLIAFFSFTFAAHGFERVAGRIRGWLTWPGPFVVALAVAVAAFGLWDTTSSPRRDYAALDADFESDRAFVQEIEQRMPDGTKVFQIPVVPFPESPPPGTMRDYDQLRPFLQSDGSTDWSYGKIKGRPNADWQWMKVRDTYGIVDSLPALAGLGFTGLYVDLFGYPGKEAELRAQLDETLGVEPLESPNGRMLFYDMRDYIKGLDQTPEQLRALAKRQLGVVAPTD